MYYIFLINVFFQLTNLKNAAELPSKIKASFDESYLQVEQNLLWYKCYHTTINQWTGAPPDPTTTEPDTTVSSSDTTVSLSDTTVSLSDTTLSSTVPPILPQPTYPTFDFDNPTPGPGVISKCPNRSGQSSCQSNLFFIIFTVTTVTTIWSFFR